MAKIVVKNEFGKVCPRCEAMLSWKNFEKSKGAYGYSTYCHDCRRKISKKYQQENYSKKVKTKISSEDSSYWDINGTSIFCL